MIIQAEILQYCCTLFGFWELSNKKNHVLLNLIILRQYANDN
jgi:hypothetical protein